MLIYGIAKFNIVELWHRRLGHMNHTELSVVNGDLVRGVPKFK